MRLPRLLLLLSFLVLICAPAAAAQTAAQQEKPLVQRNFSQYAPKLFAAAQNPVQTLPASNSLPRDTTNSRRCYTILGYNFTQDSNSPDVTRFKDTTTCAPSAQAKMKGTTLRATRP
jgi:hypothetical protein